MSTNTPSPVAANGMPDEEGVGRSPAVEQHSLLQSVLLHLLPAIPITLVYVAIAPFFVGQGFPPAFALCLAIPVALIPVQLGYLLFLGRKANGRLSLKGVVAYTERIPLWQGVGMVVLILAWSILCFAVLSRSVGGFIAETFFSWAPGWYVGVNRFEGPWPLLLATWLMILVFGSILGPVVEELYFRGYLLPRMSRLKGSAPLLNAALFALYHVWTPWEVVTRALSVWPLAYVVQRKRCLYLGMAAHVGLNLMSTLAMLSLVLK